MYNYRQMIDKAKEKGITSEAAMYAGIDDVDMMLAKLKETNPQMYWDFLRKQHKNLYKGHYDEDYARYDLSEIFYTTKNGDKIKGPYWTVEEVDNATKSMNFPAGTTIWDKYVAFNVFKSDLAKVYNDEEILRGAFEFFFKDEDFKKDNTTKIWEYMCCVR